MLFLCCLSSQQLLAQCDIGQPSGATINLSLDVNGLTTVNSSVFTPFVSSSYAQCLPANGATLLIWEDGAATIPYPTALQGPGFNCASVGTSITVFVTLNDAGPGAQSPTVPFVVTIVDNVSPILTAPVSLPAVPPATNTFAATAGTCARSLNFTPALADNCMGNLTLQHSLTHNTLGFLGTFPGLTANHLYNVGATTITWSADQDGAGPIPAVTLTRIVTVTDNQPPTYVSIISSTTLNANGGPAPGCTADRTWTHPFTSDNCTVTTYTLERSGATVEAAFTVTEGASITRTFNLGITTCTYRIDDDGAGPHVPVTQVFTVTVNDNTLPVFAAAPTIVNVATVTCTAPVTLTRSATDNCDASVGISFTVSPSAGVVLNNPAQNTGDAGGTYPVGVFTITFTAVDNFPANTATHTVTLTVTDNIDPVAACQNITVSLDASGQVVVDGIDLDNGSTDNCAVTEWQIRPDPPAGSPWFDDMTFLCSDQGANPVQFRVRDAGGNNSNPPVCNATITVVDDLPPVAQCQNITVDLNLPVGPNPTNVDVLATQINNGSMDNCTSPLTNFRIRKGTSGPFNAIGVPVNFTCAEIGPNLVEIRVGDNNGNPNFCTATVTVRDVTAPVINCNAVTMSLDPVTGLLNLTDPNPATTVTYPIGPPPPPVPIPDPGTVTTTITIPSMALMGDINLALQVNHSWVGDVSATLTSPNGTTITLFDRPGVPNSIFGCSGDNLNVTFDDEAVNSALDFETTCSNLPAIAGSFQPFNLLSAFDGENMQGVWTLTVTDHFGTDAGSIIAWSLTISNSYASQLLNTMTSSDNCRIFSWESNLEEFDCDDIDANLSTPGFQPFTYTLTVSDSDADGHAETATCQSTILIQDVTNPTAVCPVTPIDVYLDASGNATVTGALVGSGSVDNCSIADYQIRKAINDPIPPYPNGFGAFATSQNYDCGDIGLRSVRLWVRDPSNNPGASPTVGTSVYCFHAINIIDDIDPVAICNPVSVGLGSGVPGQVTIPATSISVGSTDNCLGFFCGLTREISVDNGATYNPSQLFDCTDLGSNTVKVRVTDCNGNSSVCQTTITIQDNDAPVITCPGTAIILCTDSQLPAFTGTATATDNCPPAVITSSNGAHFNIVCTGTYDFIRTWTATDGQGNASTCQQLIQVQDLAVPTFTAPADIVLDCPDAYTVADHRCTTVVSTNVPVLISDVQISTITSVININVPNNTIITDVNVLNLQVAHTWVGDLDISLTSPDGTTIILENDFPPCASQDNVDIDFDDSGDPNGTWPCPPIDGNAYQPDSPLSAFIGEDLSGTWTLTISDDENLDGGALNNWSLNICYINQPENLSLSGSVTGSDNCDTNPDETFTDYHAYKDFIDHNEGAGYNFDPTQWTQSVPFNGALSVNSSQLVLTSVDNGSAGDVSFTYNPVIPANGFIVFDWDYNSLDDGSFFDLFGYAINGIGNFQPLVDDQLVGGTAQSGRAIIPVSAGNTFAIIQRSWDGLFDPATTTVTNFLFSDFGYPLPAVDCPRSFCIARVWEVEDDCGNSAASQVQIIQTQDVTGPDIDLPATMTVLAQGGICAPTVSLDFSGNISDGCSADASLVINNSALADFGTGDGLADASGSYSPGTYPILVEAWDECGNYSSHTLTLDVIDSQNPFAVCFPAITVQLDNTGNASITPPNINNGSSDNCGIVNYSLSQSNFTTANIGQVPVTLTVTDAEGNTNSCNSIVTVLGGVMYTANSTSGTTGGMALVPVTTTGGFTNITSFQFNLNISDGAVATVVGIQDVNPALAVGFLSNVINPTTASVSWFDAVVPIGLTLAPNTLLFNVKVMLVGAAGTSTPILINNAQTSQLIGGGPLSAIVPSLGLGGTISVVGAGANYTISGTLHRETVCGNDPVHLVNVAMTGSVSNNIVNAAGSYSFTALVPSGSNVTVTPTKNINWINGVTVNDALLAHQHVAGFTLLNSPYKRIAADANHDNSITTFDVSLIHQLSIGFIPTLPGNTSWRFVPELPALPADPFLVPFGENLGFVNVMANQTNQNFIGIKIADVNCTANPVAQFGNEAGDRSEDLKFLLEDQAIIAGQEVLVTFRAKDFANYMAYQATLKFDPAVLQLTETLPGTLVSLSAGNFNPQRADEGLLAINWYNLSPVDLNDGYEIFTLKFTALHSADLLSEVLSANSDFIVTEAVNGDGDLLGVDLVFDNPNALGESEGNHFALHQNRPNPFGYRTSIGFTLPQADHAKLTILDPSGKVLKVIEGDFSAGYHAVSVERQELPATGVLFYQLETSTNRAVRKMILLD